MYTINGVEVKKAYIGSRTGKLGYVFDYSKQKPVAKIEEKEKADSGHTKEVSNQ